jgi:anti-sigma regulatory factor (Ser/Thr protein kinase)
LKILLLHKEEKMTTETQGQKITWIANHLRNVRNTGLISDVANEFNISRPSASKLVKRFISDGWIVASGSSYRPVYALGKNRVICRTYKRTEVEEDILWERDFAPFFDLPGNVRNIAHYGFTEIANNAHDHSDSEQVYIMMAVREGVLSILVADNGVGIFRKIQDAFNLPDPRLSLLELSKGKLTTDSSNHSGEGIFFTSKMFDSFEIRANGLKFKHDIRLEKDVLFDGPYDGGTAVFMSIAVDSPRKSRDVFDQFTVPGEFTFSKTIVPVRLASIGGENLISRSQAKRLVARFEGFKTVILDFEQIQEIGQAFADEVFRVFKSTHPDVELISINLSDDVRRMIGRITANAAN